VLRGGLGEEGGCEAVPGTVDEVRQLRVLDELILEMDCAVTESVDWE
jgi:hypothetical protein